MIASCSAQDPNDLIAQATNNFKNRIYCQMCFKAGRDEFLIFSANLQKFASSLKTYYFGIASGKFTMYVGCDADRYLTAFA